MTLANNNNRTNYNCNDNKQILTTITLTTMYYNIKNNDVAPVSPPRNLPDTHAQTPQPGRSLATSCPQAILISDCTPSSKHNSLDKPPQAFLFGGRIEHAIAIVARRGAGRLYRRCSHRQGMASTQSEQKAKAICGCGSWPQSLIPKWENV